MVLDYSTVHTALKLLAEEKSVIELMSLPEREKEKDGGREKEREAVE